MKTQFTWIVGAGLLSMAALLPRAQSAEESAAHKPVMINHLFTGPDGQTHAEEIEAKFAPNGELGAYKLLANGGAELRRAPPGRSRLAHRAATAIRHHA
jgi:hypothetical protein